MESRKILGIMVVAVLAMGTTVMAETVTVSQAGGADFTSIQAAIDSINATDGSPDVIQILDSAVYQEQVVLGGLPPIVETEGSFISDLVAQNRDPITLRGPATGGPAVISPNAADLLSYGVAEEDPTDTFDAALVFFGKNITIENVEVQQPGEGPYGVNGQGVDITFRGCLFDAKPDTGEPGESTINFNNSGNVSVLFGNVANDVLFDKCVFDGANEVYYHGQKTNGANTASFVFDDCTFKNHTDDSTALRGRNGSDGYTDVTQIMNNCIFMDNTANGLNFDGSGTKVADSCVFVNNGNGLDTDPTSEVGAIRIDGRDGRTGDITIRNCVFSNNTSLDASTDAPGDEWAAILVRNDGEDGPIMIDHCTLDGNGTAVRFDDGSARPRTATISNCIFSNNIGPSVTGDGAIPSYIGSGSEANLDLTITHCLFFNNGADPDIGTNDGALSGDPLYTNTDALGDDPFALGDGSPAIGAATDGSNVGANLAAAPSGVDEFMLY